MSNRKRSTDDIITKEKNKRSRLEKLENKDENEVLPEDIKDEPDNEDDEEDVEEEESEWSENDDEEEEELLEMEEALNMLKEEEPVLYNELENIKDEIKKSEPDIRELLTTPLRLEDKAKLCQYYEIYKMQMPNTYEWLHSRNQYNKLFQDCKIGYQQHVKYTKEKHEKMKEEENEISTITTELSLKYKILNLNTSKDTKAIVYRKYEELNKMEKSNEEYSKLKHWLKWATNLPYDNIKKNKITNITEFIKKAATKLDEHLFGMKKVKEQILLFLSSKILNPNMQKPNLGLVGPPGVGKTSIARLISEIMDWGFEQISFGGADKADFLKGHEYTYVGAQPGVIVKALCKMGHKNGIIFLDELEKIAENPDIRSALLHLIDQTQNKDFKDNFIGDVPIDLSKIWYIGSMNSIPRDSALADRWWIINVSGYKDTEKKEIIKKYLLPKSLKNLNLPNEEIIFTEKAITYLVNSCDSYDRGVRSIKKKIDDIINKLYFILTHQDKNGKLPFDVSFKLGYYLEKPVKVTEKILLKFVKTKELSDIIKMMYL